MTVATGSKRSIRGRAAVALPAVAGLIMGVAAVSAVLFPVPRAGAANDVVMNCNSSGSGSLAATVAGAGSGDTITFDVSCPVICPVR